MIYVCVKHSTAGRKGQLIEASGERARLLHTAGLVVPYKTHEAATGKRRRRQGGQGAQSGTNEVIETKVDPCTT